MFEKARGTGTARRAFQVQDDLGFTAPTGVSDWAKSNSVGIWKHRGLPQEVCFVRLGISVGSLKRELSSDLVYGG